MMGRNRNSNHLNILTEIKWGLKRVYFKNNVFKKRWLVFYMFAKNTNPIRGEKQCSQSVVK